jgi:hypothetical protein
MKCSDFIRGSDASIRTPSEGLSTLRDIIVKVAKSVDHDILSDKDTYREYGMVTRKFASLRKSTAGPNTMVIERINSYEN